MSAKSLARAYADVDLGSFAGASRAHLDSQLEVEEAPIWVRNLLARAFELKAVLSRLASNDAYVSQELTYEFTEGRTEAILAFATRLRSYAAALSDFDKDHSSC